MPESDVPEEVWVGSASCAQTQMPDFLFLLRKSGEELSKLFASAGQCKVGNKEECL